MRIAFVSGSYPPIKCGIGDYTARLVRALSELRVPTLVVTSRGVTANGDPESVDAPSVLPLGNHWNWRECPAILAALSRWQPSVVIVQYPTRQYGRRMLINLLPLLIRWRLHVPVVFTVHEYGSYTALGKVRIALSAAVSQAIVVPDRENHRMMQNDLLLRGGELEHVPLGPNIEPALGSSVQRDQWRDRFEATSSTLVLSYFGFLSPSKGVETLLEAVQMVATRQPDLDWRLLLIADRQPVDNGYARYHKSIEALLAKWPASGRVVWTGYCTSEEVSRYLASSDMCVLPFSDGASLRRTTLLTALSHGLPVVSTHPRGHPEPELRDGQNIALVPPHNAAALATAIQNLAGDGEHRAALARGATELAQTFSWEATARRVLSICETARCRALPPPGAGDRLQKR